MLREEQNTNTEHSDMVVLRSILERRRSCRQFRPEPVPESVVLEMFELARATASWCNTQPWQTWVMSGDVVRELSSRLIDRVGQGEESPDIPPPAGYSGVYRQRRREAGFALYESLGIPRSDSEGRKRQMMRNFEFFDAPHVAIITTDAEQGTYGAVDCGAYVTNLLNAATALGVSTIPQAAIAMYSDTVRDYLDLSEDRLILCGVSFGYVDAEADANAFCTSRAEVAEAVTFVT